jgi:preprotein translocase subunit SecG
MAETSNKAEQKKKKAREGEGELETSTNFPPFLGCVCFVFCNHDYYDSHMYIRDKSWSRNNGFEATFTRDIYTLTLAFIIIVVVVVVVVVVVCSNKTALENNTKLKRQKSTTAKIFPIKYKIYLNQNTVMTYVYSDYVSHSLLCWLLVWVVLVLFVLLSHTNTNTQTPKGRNVRQLREMSAT